MGIKQFTLKSLLPKKTVTVARYVHLKPSTQEYVQYIIKHLKPNKVLKIKDRKADPKVGSLWNLSWMEVIQIQEAFEEQENKLFDILSIVYDIPEDGFLNCDIFSFFSAYKWIVEELKDIEKKYDEMFGDIEMSDEDKAAGAEQLSKYGYSVALRAFTKGDVTKNKSVLSLPYIVIFKEMCLNSELSEIYKRKKEHNELMDKIKNR